MSGLESLSRGELLALIAVQQRQIEQLTAANAVLADANRHLAERVADLEKRLGRNSGNSSMPPSSDVFTKPAKPELPKSGRKRGRQSGASGSGLALVADPDDVRDRFPSVCGGCGVGFRGLGPQDSAGYQRRQCTDIPQVSARVAETRWHRVVCGCGHESAAPVPAEVSDGPCYGPNLKALAVYLLVYQHVPVQRAAELIGDLTGARVSTGWVAAQLPKAAGLVAEPIRLIKALLVLAHVLHADETTTRIGATRRYLHVACTPALTFLGLAPRSRAGACGLGILPHFRGTMVHDAFFQLYDGFPNARHQLCCSHVIRELTAQDELFPQQKWADQIRWALARLIEMADRCRREGLAAVPPDQCEQLLRVYHQGVAVGLSRHPRTSKNDAQSDATNLLERLRDHADSYLLFLKDLHVPPTNNLGERDQRPVKTQVKISGCHQSETGAAHWLTVRSYLSSARKHGMNAFDALRMAMTGNPWMPPIALQA